MRAEADDFWRDLRARQREPYGSEGDDEESGRGHEETPSELERNRPLREADAREAAEWRAMTPRTREREVRRLRTRDKTSSEIAELDHRSSLDEFVPL